jgi:tetratricopeptide (TPR) repeat protein
VCNVTQARRGGGGARGAKLRLLSSSDPAPALPFVISRLSEPSHATTAPADLGDPPIDPAALGDTLNHARSLHEANEPAAALRLARSVWEGVDDTPMRVEAGRLVCISSYRLGELAEAIRAGDATLQLLEPGVSLTLRFDLLTVLVVAYGELARYDEAVQALRQLLAVAARRGRLRDHARSRSSMAACFALMGDPWTAQRLLSQLASALQAMPRQSRLEARARLDLAWICLQAARMARDAADPDMAGEMLAVAHAHLERSDEIAAQQAGASRIAVFSQMHQCEFDLLRGLHGRALERLAGALVDAERLQLHGHVRRLLLIQAELLLETGAPREALDVLEPLLQQLGPGHELSARIQSFDLAARACVALGDTTRGVVCMERQRALELYRMTRQLQALARHAQARLEFEHLSAEDPPASLEHATGPSKLEH